MSDQMRTVIERGKLENGMELVLYDSSRIIAGDRWLVELLCEAHIPIPESSWERTPGEDAELLPDIRKMLGGELVYSSSRKRNFVEEEKKDEILQELKRQLHDSAFEYLSRPQFPLRLFQKQYKDCRRKIMIRRAMNRHG